MRFSKLNRQFHRWVSIVFATVVAALFAALGMGVEPASWAYFLPLPPLALLMLSGLYMFFQPYASRRSRAGSGAEGNA